MDQSFSFNKSPKIYFLFAFRPGSVIAAKGGEKSRKKKLLDLRDSALFSPVLPSRPPIRDPSRVLLTSAAPLSSLHD